MSAILLTKKEAAELLGGVSVRFIDRLIVRRVLPKVCLTKRSIRIPRRAIEEFIEERTIKSTIQKSLTRKSAH